MKKLANLVLAGVLGLSAGCYNQNVEFHPNSALSLEERLGEFSKQEKKLISNSLKKIEKKYRLPSEIVFIRANKRTFEDDTSARTYTRLGHAEDSKQDFINLFGDNLYKKLEGRDVVVLRGFKPYLKYAKDYNSNTFIARSLYLENPNAEQLFQRAVIHEAFHIFADRILTPELTKKIIMIDVENKVYDMDGKNHPAHPSYYSYFWCGCPGLYKNGEPISGECEEKHRYISLGETIAEAMSLSLLGCFDKGVEDKLLAQKLKLFKEAMKPYEK